MVFLWNTLLCGRLNEIVHDAWVCRLGDHQVYRDQHTRVYIGSQFTRQHSTRLLQYLWFDIWTGHSVHIFLVWENLLKMPFSKLRFNVSKWQGTRRSWPALSYVKKFTQPNFLAKNLHTKSEKIAMIFTKNWNCVNALISVILVDFLLEFNWMCKMLTVSVQNHTWCL